MKSRHPKRKQAHQRSPQEPPISSAPEKQTSGQMDVYLAQSARLFADEIVATLREPLLLLDANLRIEFANRSFYTTFQASPNATVTHLIFDLGNGQWDIPALRTLLEEILVHDHVFEDFEVTHVFPSIGQRTMLLNARKLRQPGDHPERILLAIEDITERKRIEEAQIEQARVANFGTDVAIALTQLDTMVAMLQSCAEAMVRHLEAAIARIWTLNEKEQVLELQASAGLYSNKNDAHSRVPVGGLRIGRIAQERTPHLTNAVIGDPLVPNQAWAKREGMVAFAGYPLIVEQRLVGVMALFARYPLTDVTLQALGAAAYGIALGIERKRVEDERSRLLASEQSARAAAQEAVRVRDAFLSLAAHELKNPLTSLLGNAQLLQRRAARAGAASDDNQRAIQAIAEQARRLDELLTDLLDVSRMELGQLTIVRTPMDLVALLHRVMDELQPTFEQHTIIWSGGDAPALVNGDELRLEQVFHNLLHNAVKYSPRGGTVTLHRIQHANQICIAVRDEGIGIPEAALPQLFRRFYRAENAAMHRISGTGIGLYVVKEIVTLHDGEVTVVSAEGKGSIFTVCLPLLSA